jgi:VWFA-related protein
MTRTRLALVGAAALAFAWSGQTAGQSTQAPPPRQPQDQQAPPTFRATTALVEVDAIVHDRQGKFVPGLTAEDLELFEDGRPQAIQQFYMVTNDPSARGSLAGQAQPGGPSEDRAHRVFVMLFDEGHLAVDSILRVKDGAEEFIRTHVGPSDLAGVFVNGAMFKGRLTANKNDLLLGIRAARPVTDHRQALLAPFKEFPRIPSEIDAVRIEAGALEVVDRLGEQACRDDPFQCNDIGGPNQVENLIQNKAKLYVRQARVNASRTVQNLQYVINGLSRIAGRKTIVLLSEGFFVEDFRDVLQIVAAQAARGGITIYALDGRGMHHRSSPTSDVSSNDMARATAFDTGEDAPRILTTGTGGLMLANTDNISGALGAIARDTSTYYVIGYAPENTRLDGKFRKIEVKPRVRGLNVRARKGYLAAPLPPLQSIRSGGR